MEESQRQIQIDTGRAAEAALPLYSMTSADTFWSVLTSMLSKE
jgi:hypothetical protein